MGCTDKPDKRRGNIFTQRLWNKPYGCGLTSRIKKARPRPCFLKFNTCHDFFAEDFFAALFLVPDFFAELFFAAFFGAAFFAGDFFAALFLDADFLAGTFAPASLASDKPIAMACFLLVTFCPELLLSVPALRSCMVFSTLSCAFLEYFAMILCFDDSLLPILMPAGERSAGTALEG